MSGYRFKTDKDGKVVKFIWTVQDEAIHRGNNYANSAEETLKQLDWKPPMHSLLKNAYQEGFLHGFEHKFDETHYEEK